MERVTRSRVRYGEGKLEATRSLMELPVLPDEDSEEKESEATREDGGDSSEEEEEDEEEQLLTRLTPRPVLTSTVLRILQWCMNILPWCEAHPFFEFSRAPRNVISRLDAILVARATEWGHLHRTPQGCSVLGIVFLVVAHLRVFSFTRLQRLGARRGDVIKSLLLQDTDTSLGPALSAIVHDVPKETPPAVELDDQEGGMVSVRHVVRTTHSHSPSTSSRGR